MVQFPIQKNKTPLVQTKLTIGQPGDKYEQEADSMADKVMSMSQSDAPIQRQCEDCEKDTLQMKPLAASITPLIQMEPMKGEDDMVQAKSEGGSMNTSTSLSSQLSQSKGGGMGLPNSANQQMSSAFGTDFSRVRIHTDSNAIQMNRSMGAKAFTNGNDVYFNKGEYQLESRKGQHLLAHELTHVVQQGGDSSAIQRYTIVGGERVADDGKMVVDDHTKDAWALESDIDKSNKIFSGISSERSLTKTAIKRKVKVPRKTTEHELTKYKIDAPNLKKNCGRAALQMLGHNVTGEREYVGVTNKRTTQEFTDTATYRADDQAPGGLVSTTEEMSGKIYKKIFLEKEKKTFTRTEAITAWDALSSTKKTAYAKEYGINEFAVPKVGQSITMGTEFDMPGFKDDTAMGRPNSTWNFHFGTPVITSGKDYTTAENFTGSSHDYYFSMFGPETKGQSWYDEQKPAGFGNKHTAMVVQHPETLIGEINTNNVKLVASPDKFVVDGSGIKAHLVKGTGLKIIRKGNSWMKVEVTSGKEKGKKGWIMNRFFKDT